MEQLKEFEGDFLYPIMETKELVEITRQIFLTKERKKKNKNLFELIGKKPAYQFRVDMLNFADDCLSSSTDDVFDDYETALRVFDNFKFLTELYKKENCFFDRYFWKFEVTDDGFKIVDKCMLCEGKLIS